MRKATLFRKIAVFIEPGSSGSERIMSADDLILALYGIGTIFPVITMCASLFGRREGGAV
jgi:hypothetical protein